MRVLVSGHCWDSHSIRAVGIVVGIIRVHDALRYIRTRRIRVVLLAVSYGDRDTVALKFSWFEATHGLFLIDIHGGYGDGVTGGANCAGGWPDLDGIAEERLACRLIFSSPQRKHPVDLV